MNDITRFYVDLYNYSIGGCANTLEINQSAPIKLQDRINNQITKIISDCNYHPNQWISETKAVMKLFGETSHMQRFLDPMIDSLIPQDYNKLPEEWWVLVCPIMYDKINLLASRYKFLDQIILLSDLRR